MTNVIRLDPDGSIVKYEKQDPLYMGRVEFDTCSVVTCNYPNLAGIHVGVIHDFGKDLKMPVNMNAWALYGRSPIYGPMFFAKDAPYPSLHTEIIELIENDKLIWPELRKNMERVLSIPDEDYNAQTSAE